MESKQNKNTKESTQNSSTVETSKELLQKAGAMLGTKTGSILMPSLKKKGAGMKKSPVEEEIIQKLMEQKKISREQAEAILMNPF